MITFTSATLCILLGGIVPAYAMMKGIDIMTHEMKQQHVTSMKFKEFCKG
jgi:hypothetical protein